MLHQILEIYSVFYPDKPVKILSPFRNIPTQIYPKTKRRFILYNTDKISSKTSFYFFCTIDAFLDLLPPFISEVKLDTKRA